jgi:hypothetical protein
VDLSRFERAAAAAAMVAPPKPAPVELVPRHVAVTPRSRYPARYNLGLLGSAAEVYANDPDAAQELARTRQTWQRRAIDFDSSIPEVWYTNAHFANTVAGGRLFAGRKEVEGQAPVEITDPNDLAVVTLADIGSGMESTWGQQGQAALIRISAWHLLVPGEFYGYMWTDPQTGVNQWDVFSIDQLEPGPRGFQTRRYPGEQPTEIPEDAAIRRIWWPDPQWPGRATSPMRAQMDVLEELKLLGAAGIASLWSRLITGGILKVPSEIDFGKDPTSGDPVEFIDMLQQAMMTAMRDPSSVARFVPISAKAKGESLQYLEHMTIGKDTTETELDRRKEAVERYARGAPVPKERVLGFGESKYWNVFAIKEDEWGHYAPVVDVMLWGWTVAFLRPLLEGQGYEGWDSIVIGYDRSPIVGKPDKSASATEGLTLGVLAPRVWRREHDYEEDDAPTPAEWTMMLQWKTGAGSEQPALSTPGPPASTPGAPQGQPAAPPENAPPGTITAAAVPRGRRLALGGIDQALMLKIATAADAALQRAAERAGNKLRAKVTRNGSHATLAASIDGVRAHRVAATFGPARVHALGFTEDELIEGAAATFAARARPWITVAQREALRRIAQATEQRLSDLEDLTALTREEGAAAAVRKLADGFTARAHAFLYDPSPEFDVPGEASDLSAPHAAIREAVALAGGGERGIGSGPLATEALRAGGFETALPSTARRSSPRTIRLSPCSRRIAGWASRSTNPRTMKAAAAHGILSLLRQVRPERRQRNV